MRKLLLIISSAIFLSVTLDACKRGPGDCGDGKENGDETSLDCGPSCKLCPPPIAPEGNYIIGRIGEKFFTEQKDTNLYVSSFKVGNSGYELFSNAGFYQTKKQGNLLIIEDTNIVIGIAQSFVFDTTKIPTALDFISRIDTGYQRFGGLTSNNEISKDGFFILYKNKAAVADSNIVYTTYNGPYNIPNSYVFIKKIERVDKKGDIVSTNPSAIYNLKGEFQCYVYAPDQSKRIFIDKGRFDLNFKIR
jgi:hypothetical protein